MKNLLFLKFVAAVVLLVELAIAIESVYKFSITHESAWAWLAVVVLVYYSLAVWVFFFPAQVAEWVLNTFFADDDDINDDWQKQNSLTDFEP